MGKSNYACKFHRMIEKSINDDVCPPTNDTAKDLKLKINPKLSLCKF